jgi:hypothetical protein
MNILFVRSPYTFQVDGTNLKQARCKLYLWNEPNILPTTPTYEFYFYPPTPTQTKGYFNISNECLEFINPTFPTSYSNYNSQESYNHWCYAKVIVEWATTIEDPEWIEAEGSGQTYICVNGYTEYTQGRNFAISSALIYPLMNGIYPVMNSYAENDYYINIPNDNGIYPYVDFLVQDLANENNFTYFIQYYYLDGSVGTFVQITTLSSGVKMIRMPLRDLNITRTKPYYVILYQYDVANDEYIEVFKHIMNPLCTPKYPVKELSFINKLGGWEFLYCMGNSEEKVDMTNTDYRFAQPFNYDIHVGQRQTFNTNGRKGIKLNTGWVPEKTKILIEQLLFSETILIDKVPVVLKTKSSVLKKTLKEKMINYTFEFEYKFNAINNVI